MTETQKLISRKCDKIKTMLLEKNKGYGNSALDPMRIFSRCSPTEQLAVRLDDKISRIARGDMSAVGGETYLVTLDDLIGYAILLAIAMEDGKSKNTGQSFCEILG